MNKLLPLLLLAGTAQAHVADVSPLQHALEHSWLLLPLLPLIAWLVPRVRGRR